MSVKSFDPSKFRKSLTKSITGMSSGFRDPKVWISTGNYTLNYLISGDFYKGIPLGKVSVFAGQSGSAKSLICSGNIVKDAQNKNIFVVLIDSENALDELWLNRLGVDTSEDKLLKLNMAMIDDVGKTISSFMKDYVELPEEERPKVLFVVDSLGMLMTPTEVNQFEAGDMKGDMGRKAKALKALVTNCVNMFGAYDIGMVATNHTYASQDMFDPDDKISGGSGFLFASSIVVAMKKLKLKEDEHGKKTTEVNGIRSSCKVMKSRFSKPFESVEIKIPYDKGVDPYSGLMDLFEKKGIIKQQGNRLKYINMNNEECIDFRKNWKKEWLDDIMNNWDYYNYKTNDINDEIEDQDDDNQ